MSDFLSTLQKPRRLIIELPAACGWSEQWRVVVSSKASTDRTITIKQDEEVVARYDCKTGEKIE